MGLIDQRLTELGYVLPEATSPAGSYITVVRTGNLLFTGTAPACLPFASV